MRRSVDANPSAGVRQRVESRSSLLCLHVLEHIGKESCRGVDEEATRQPVASLKGPEPAGEVARLTRDVLADCEMYTGVVSADRSRDTAKKQVGLTSH